MSNLKLKQVDSTSAVVGGTVLYDGVALVYTNNDDGAMQLPVGDDTSRPAGANGLLRYNSNLNCFEGYINGSWVCLVDQNDSSIKPFQRTEVTTATYSVVTADTYIGVNSNVDTTITLPSIPTEGQELTVKDEAGQARQDRITIDGNGNTIDSEATVVIGVNYGGLQLVYAGTEWHII